MLLNILQLSFAILLHVYLGVVMMVDDKRCPQLVCNDPHGQFFVFKSGGIYAHNNATPHFELWSSIHQNQNIMSN